MDSLLISSIDKFHAGSNYSGIACDGSCIYFTNPGQNRVESYSFFLMPKKIFKTFHRYRRLCYDCYLDCFWATDYYSNTVIYKLDCCFCEVLCFNININCDCIKNIAVKDFSNLIIITKNKSIVVKKTDGCIDCTDYTKNDTEVWAIGYGCNREITVLSSGFGKILRVKSFDCGKCIECFLPCNICIEGICVCKSNSCCEELIYILGCKNECCGENSYVIKCVYNDNVLSIPDCQECINEILDSVAKVELSISHILNSEGEKIQKILSKTDCPRDIINVNKSVNETIVNITHLEQSLYSKLLLCHKITENLCPS